MKKREEDSSRFAEPVAIELHLEYFSQQGEDFDVPLETAIVYFVLRFCDVVGEEETPSFRILLKRRINSNGAAFVSIKPNLDSDLGTVGGETTCCKLPALYVPELDLRIAGLCSVLRYLLKHLGNEKAKRLLGHQGSCLSAPAEVSTWTRFCEIDVLSAASKVLRVRPRLRELPAEFGMFEKHLDQPIRMHNIRKRMQQDESRRLGTIVAAQDPIREYARTQHLFAEGPDFLLSDVILFLVYSAVFREVPLRNLEAQLPLTVGWFERLSERANAVQVSSELLTRQAGPSETSVVRVSDVPNQSLYKSDPSRVNPNSRAFTRQHAVEEAMRWFRSSQISCARTSAANRRVFKVDWDSLPQLVHPLHGGKLPASRADKKCQQLENVAEAVMNLASRRSSDRLTIVDFCSGGGHISILLSYLLPNATVIMVENKVESLERAMLRVRKLGLKNCRFFQGNLDYFRGDFDVGVSLHACGIATDLAIRLCVQKKADFVVCPCCYGSVRENHALSYPRSKLFRAKMLTFETYLVIGHTADQTHFDNAKLEQGYLAMDIIDTDRVQMALENGYHEVVLQKLDPPTCTPKNNLIAARYKGDG